MFHLELSAVNLVVEKVKVNKFRRSLKGYTNLDAYTIRVLFRKKYFQLCSHFSGQFGPFT